MTILILAIWLIILTFLYWKSQRRFYAVFKNANEHSVAAVLGKLVKEYDVTRKEIETLKSSLESVSEQSLLHLQKVGLLRFNPFHDTGGEQSFILTLLDAKDSGIIISGLYARTGMRFYVKNITHGKSKEHELSAEEQKAISISK